MDKNNKNDVPDELEKEIENANSRALANLMDQRALQSIDHKRDLQTVKENIERVHDILKNQMQEDVHYGIIPGTDKRTLFKAGAELISMNFGVRPEYDIVINKFPPDEYPNLPAAEFHREYEVTCRLFKYFGHGSEVELCQGIGTCSTLESKFRYRYGKQEFTGKALPIGFWEKYNRDKTAAKAMLPKGFGFGKTDRGDWQLTKKGQKEENPDIADVWNTVKKIAKKRAYVDSINTFVAASNIFAKAEDEIESDDDKVKDAVDSNGISDATFTDVAPGQQEMAMSGQDLKDPYPDLTIPELVIPQVFIDRIMKYKDLPDGAELLKQFIDNHTHDLAFFNEIDKNPIQDAYREVRKYFEGKKKSN